MLLNILTIYVLAQGLAVAQNLTDVPWPNSFPKQLAAVRRRQGLTTSEFTYHHAIVHGRKSWNAPDSVDQPLAYVQDHVFDSAYGINTTANHAHVNYFGHNDMTELYSRSEEAFATPPPNNYTATVIGPDGNAFNDFSSSINMFGREEFYEVKDTCQSSSSSTTFNAFYWVFANASNANTSSFDNTTFAAPIMRNLLAAFSPGTIYNASVHTSVPGLESRSYYGGFNNPTLNAVLKFWLCDDYSAVAAFRNAQLGLVSQNDELGINLNQSFVIFTRAVLIYDRSTNTPFDTDRVAQALRANRFRDTVGGPL